MNILSKLSSAEKESVLTQFAAIAANGEINPKGQRIEAAVQVKKADAQPTRSCRPPWKGQIGDCHRAGEPKAQSGGGKGSASNLSFRSTIKGKTATLNPLPKDSDPQLISREYKRREAYVDKLHDKLYKDFDVEGSSGRDLRGKLQALDALSHAKDPRFGLIAKTNDNGEPTGFLSYKIGGNIRLESIGTTGSQKGDGRALFTELAKIAIATKKRIEVASGESAEGFYEKMGMEKVDESTYEMSPKTARALFGDAKKDSINSNYSTSFFFHLDRKCGRGWKGEHPGGCYREVKKGEKSTLSPERRKKIAEATKAARKLKREIETDRPLRKGGSPEEVAAAKGSLKARLQGRKARTTPSMRGLQEGGNQTPAREARRARIKELREKFIDGTTIRDMSIEDLDKSEAMLRRSYKSVTGKGNKDFDREMAKPAKEKPAGKGKRAAKSGLSLSDMLKKSNAAVAGEVNQAAKSLIESMRVTDEGLKRRRRNNLSQRSLKDLRNLAKDEGLKGATKMKKGDLIDSLMAKPPKPKPGSMQEKFQKEVKRLENMGLDELMKEADRIGDKYQERETSDLTTGDALKGYKNGPSGNSKNISSFVDGMKEIIGDIDRLKSNVEKSAKKTKNSVAKFKRSPKVSPETERAVKEIEKKMADLNRLAANLRLEVANRVKFEDAVTGRSRSSKGKSKVRQAKNAIRSFKRRVDSLRLDGFIIHWRMDGLDMLLDAIELKKDALRTGYGSVEPQPRKFKIRKAK